MTKRMTAKQYAEMMDASDTAVKNAMRAGKVLSNVQSYEKIGRDWVLYVLQHRVKNKCRRKLVCSV